MQTIILDFISFAIYVASVTVFIIINIKQKKTIRSLSASLIQEAIDKKIYMEKLADELDKASMKPVEKTDEFLKFVSDSRDWAFSYIEDTQAMVKLVADKNTELISKINSKSNKSDIYEAFKELSALVKKLENLLPE